MAEQAAEIGFLQGTISALEADRSQQVGTLERKVAEQAAEIDSLQGTIAALYGSRSWRVTSVLRSLSRLRYGLFNARLAWRAVHRRRFSVSPIPLQHLEFHEEEAKWQSTGGDPIFELKVGKRQPRGWVRIRAELAIPEGELLGPVLYVDAGEGYSEEGRIKLNVPQNGMIDMIVRLPDRVEALRFDPLERAGEFRLGRLEFQEMGRLEVGVRIIGRLLRRHVRSLGDMADLAGKAAGPTRAAASAYSRTA